MNKIYVIFEWPLVINSHPKIIKTKKNNFDYIIYYTLYNELSFSLYIPNFHNNNNNDIIKLQFNYLLNQKSITVWLSVYVFDINLMYLDNLFNRIFVYLYDRNLKLMYYENYLQFKIGTTFVAKFQNDPNYVYFVM